MGDIVLLKDETLRTRDWPLALITELHPGDDGVSRVATLRCCGKIYQRPVHRLVHLVTDADEDLQSAKESTPQDSTNSASSDYTSSAAPPEYVRDPYPNRASKSSPAGPILNCTQN